jgi:signal transduction protein with GAF and PtsI domain
MLEQFPAVGHGRKAGNEAHASVPLRLHDRVLGVLTLSLQEVHVFSNEEAAYLEALAQQAAQALERARLYAAEQWARSQAEAAQQQLVLLADASVALATSLGVDETLKLVPTLMLPALGDFCLVFAMRRWNASGRWRGSMLTPTGGRGWRRCWKLTSRTLATPSAC